MGRWSRHPMGSDGALDARDCFMEFADLVKVDDDGEEETVYYFERPKEEIRDLLLGLNLEQIKEYADNEFVHGNEFVIPYTFIEYEAYPTDPKIKKYLKECLDYCDDFEEYGNGEEMRHVNIFRDNFEDIITGKKILEEDAGLFAAFAEALDNGDVGAVNAKIVDDDND